MSRWLRYALMLGTGLAATAFQASPPIVRAVLFYSPTCPHCQMVMTQTLPPLMSRYGDQLEILGIDVTQPGGQALYQAAVESMGIPDERRGVPTLVMGPTVLVGSDEIPNQFPDLIQAGLRQGGVDWPAIPALLAALPAEASHPAEAPGVVRPWAPFSIDPVGGVMATLVLLATLATMIWAGARALGALLRDEKVTSLGQVDRPSAVRRWLPALAAAGALISVYLVYVETSGGQAFCGPVGDCNAVQHSPYAHLFGILPVALLGVLGFGAILLLHFLPARRAGQPADWTNLALLCVTLTGAAFSAYLTSLEAFVIQAVCSWCLASAVLMTLLLGLSIGEAVPSLGRLRRRPRPA
jgi:uncharacterized membrane protein/thiol-disulfide isomerase/thioredoxin